MLAALVLTAVLSAASYHLIEQPFQKMEIAKPAMDSIAAVQREIPGVVVLDVLSPLCPGDECSVLDKDGRPLFTDQDHLSGWGNERLLPAIRAALASARSTMSAAPVTQ